jgi:transcriptional regulator with XRE-family HTH domain
MITQILKDRRKALGLTQIQVAELAGLSTRTVMRAEKGDDIDLMTQRKLCRALDLDYEVITAALTRADASVEANPDRAEDVDCSTLPVEIPRPIPVEVTVRVSTAPGLDVIEPAGGQRPAEFDQLVWALGRYGSTIDFYAVPDVAAYRAHGLPSRDLIRSRTTLGCLRQLLGDTGVQGRQIAFQCIFVLGFAAVLAIYLSPPQPTSPAVMGALCLALLAIIAWLAIDLVRISRKTLRREQRDHVAHAEALSRTVYGFSHRRVYAATAQGEHVAIKDYPIHDRRPLPAIRCGAALSYEFAAKIGMLRALPDHPRIRHRLNYVPNPKGADLVNTEGRFTANLAP